MFREFTDNACFASLFSALPHNPENLVNRASRPLRSAFAGVIAIAIASSSASAQTFFGTDADGSQYTRATNVSSLAARNAFLSNLVGVGTEDFESRSGGSPLNLTFLGAGTAQLTGIGTVQTFSDPGANGAGRYATSGAKFWEARTSADPAETFKVTFGSEVAAFGFYGIDIGDFGSQLTLQFDLVGGGTYDWLLPYTASNGTNSPRDGSLLFAGYINTVGFTAVTFKGTSVSDAFAFDDMTVGSKEQVSTVPEPSTYLMMAVGMSVLGFASRRRRQV